MSGENQDTNTDILTARYRSKRNQATLNIELAIAGAAASSSATSAPGSVGAAGGSVVINETTGGGGGPPRCPELSQWVKIQDDFGIVSVQVVAVQVGFYLWNPLARAFEKVVSADVFDGPLWEVTDGWVSAIGSPSHPIIRTESDATGTALEKCSVGQTALIDTGEVRESSITSIKPAGEGKIKKIETEGPGHIYSAGSSPTEMFVFHNAKPIDPFENA